MRTKERQLNKLESMQLIIIKTNFCISLSIFPVVSKAFFKLKWCSMPGHLCDIFIPITRTPDLFIPHLKSTILPKLFINYNFYWITLHDVFVYKARAVTYFFALKKYGFLFLALLLNFWIQWYSNILN